MPQPQPPCVGTDEAVRRHGRDSRRHRRPPVLSVAQARGKLLAQLAYGAFDRRIPGGVIAIHSLGFRGRDLGTASWVDGMIAAQGLDDGLGSAARVQTAAGRSTATPERFERRAKPSRLFEQLLKAPFDTAADHFKARHSSQILMIEGAPSRSRNSCAGSSVTQPRPPSRNLPE